MTARAGLDRAEVTPAPDLFEPLLGYRFWKVSANGTLRCLISRERWSPGENRARCWLHDHDAPGRLCRCGFNALHELPDARRRDEYRNVVLGAIAAWGSVEVHRLGFRAEFARVVALAEDGAERPAPPRRLARAARRYGVPVVPLESLPSTAGRYARPAGAAVRPGGRQGPGT